MLSFRYRIALTIVVSMGWASVASGVPCDVVVYDNTAAAVYGDFVPSLQEGCWRFVQLGAGSPNGDVVHLAGTQREICRFEVMLTTFEAGPEGASLDSFTLTFHEIPDDFQIDYEPFWSSDDHPESLPPLPVTVNGPTMVTFDIPEVVVPDVFAWALRAEGDVSVSGLATYGPPTVGGSDPSYYINVAHDYGFVFTTSFAGSPVANFGARITATPEPASLGVLALGALAIGRRKNAKKK